MIRYLDEHVLAQHADAIRSLGKRVVADVIEIGRRLTEARDGQGFMRTWRLAAVA
jgi:hypothetical protein